MEQYEELKDETEVKAANYLLQAAKDDLRDAKLLYESGSFRSSINRSYFSVFHAARAILVFEKVIMENPRDSLHYFIENYAENKVFPNDMGSKIIDTEDVWLKSDYDIFYIPTIDVTIIQIQTAEAFIDYVEDYFQSRMVQDQDDFSELLIT